LIPFLLTVVLAEAFVIAWLAEQQGRERTRNTLAWLTSLKDKDADIRALTEALVRSEGKAIIFPRRGPLQPSEGWWDKKQPPPEGTKP
jgi:hypothetical protein